MATVGGSPNDEREAIAALVRDVGESRREIGDEELRRVREYLARETLVRPRQVDAHPDILGYPHPRHGRPITADDTLDVQVVKYLKHVVEDAEWPGRTTVEGYLASLARVVRSERSAVYLEPGKDRWMTGFRPGRGLTYVTQHESTSQGRWPRRPLSTRW